MVRWVFGVLAIGASVAIASTARAQNAAPITVVPGSETAHGFFAAPGNYGVSLGTPSYGSVRTDSSFSSPYGAGYRYGYAPSGFLPGRFGVGLWRPGYAATPLDNAGYHSYRTFPVPYRAQTPAVTPPLGLYAPAFGPPSLPGR